jgi:hypothetical protein
MGCIMDREMLASLRRTIVLDRDETLWKTKAGKHIRIVDMEDSHLLNVIKYFRRSSPASMLDDWEKYKNVIKEAEKRGLDYGDDWDK